MDSSNSNIIPLIENHSDHEEIRDCHGLVKEVGQESKRLWQLAAPAIFTAICQYSLGALTQTFAGQVGELELAAVSVENSVVAGLAFGIMVLLISFHSSSLWNYYYFSFFLYLVGEIIRQSGFGRCTKEKKKSGFERFHKKGVQTMGFSFWNRENKLETKIRATYRKIWNRS